MDTNQTADSEMCIFLKHAVEQTPQVFIGNIITCVLDFLVAIIATVSNALIIYVIWKKDSLHSVSNTLLACLAVTDFLVGMSVAPLNILTKVGEMIKSDKLYCVAGVTTSLIGWTSASMSYITLALISVERYLALCFHTTYVTMVTTKRILKIVACFWLCTLALGVFRFWDTKETIIRPIVMATMTLCVVLTVFCYSKIFALARKHSRQIREQARVFTIFEKNQLSTSGQVAQSHNRVLETQLARQKRCTLNMAYILGFFIVCCLPVLAYQVVVAIAKSRVNVKSLRVAYRFCWSVALMNSALNPALYCFRIVDIRQAVKSVIIR